MEKDSSGINVIKVSEFKVNCSKLIRSVTESGEPLIITKYGRPLVKLVPYEGKSLLGMFKDDIRIIGDIMEPLDVEWDAMKDDDDDLL